MNDRPIIFSGPMIRALIEGRKTQTRRLAWSDRKPSLRSTLQYSRRWDGSTPWQRVKPGDRLWVREAFHIAHVNCWGNLSKTRVPKPVMKLGRFEVYDDQAAYYRADYDRSGRPRWRPSIHMPRWASRLTLTVTETRIERLEDISWDDALAEGVVDTGRRDGEPWPHCVIPGISGLQEAEAQAVFLSLWERLHGVGSTNANPEVVALTFTVEQRNIDSNSV